MKIKKQEIEELIAENETIASGPTKEEKQEIKPSTFTLGDILKNKLKKD